MLNATLIVGLLGAALMFCGDMALYYDRNDFEQNGSLGPIIDIMKKLPRKRVMLGGWIGPVAGRSVFAAASDPEAAEGAVHDPGRRLHQHHFYRVLSGGDPDVLLYLRGDARINAAGAAAFEATPGEDARSSSIQLHGRASKWILRIED